MGSLERFIKRIAVQSVIYWGTPTKDGTGGFTFADPVELLCRWDDFSELITADNGKEIVSKAKLLMVEDLDKGGYLRLGSLDDYDSGVDLSNPKNIEGAYPIKRIEKIPMIKKTNDFVRTIYLGGKNV